jgi:hypothetical protein
VLRVETVHELNNRFPVFFDAEASSFLRSQIKSAAVVFLAQ